MSEIKPVLPALYSIGQVSKILGVHPNTLRLWDQKGIFQPLRSHATHIRRYSKSQIDLFLSQKQTTSTLRFTSRDFPLASLSHDLICVLNQQHQVVYSNRSFNRTLGLRSEKVKMIGLSNFVGQKYLTQIVKSVKLSGVDVIFTTHSGKQIWINLDVYKMNYRGLDYKVLIGRNITKNRLMTQELQQHKERLELINQQMQGMFDHAPAGIALFDSSPVPRLLSSNLVYRKIWSVFAPDAQPKPISQIITKYSGSRLQKYFQKVLVTKKAITFYNLKFDLPQGPVWLDGEISPIQVKGQIVALAHMIIDVTQEVLAQQKLRLELRQKKLSEQRLSRQNRLLVQERLKLNLTEQASRLGVFVWPIGSTKTSWTRQLEKLYGLKPGQFRQTYEHWISMVHPEDRTRAVSAVSNAINNGRFEIEYRIVWPDNSVHWVYCRGKVFHDPSGRPQNLIGINMDITKRKTIEAKLLESEQRFRLIAENMIDVVTIFNNQKKFLYVSPSISMHFNQPTAYFINKTIFEVGFPSRLISKLAQGLDQVFSTKKPQTADFSSRGRYYQTILAPEINQKGQVNTVISVTRDITNLRMLEKRKDEFLSIASHELKTPLSSIKAYSQILQQSYSSFSSDQLVSILSKQNQHVDRLNRLISDLLDLSRIQSGRFQFSQSVFDFDQLVRESVESVQSFSPSHQIIISGTTLTKIKADRHRLEQVLVNLLTNAVKYSPNSDRVNVRLTRPGSNIEVSVEDFGIGISPGDKKHIFERFYRTPQVEKQYPGLGIGLFISHQIIRRHKGKLGFVSTLNKGSTFYFRLPVKNLLPND